MTNNAHDMQSAAQGWIGAETSKGSADVMALVALVPIVNETFPITIKGETINATVSDAVTHIDAKVRAASKKGFIVRYCGYDADDKIPGAVTTGFDRVIRPAILLAHHGIAPTLKTVATDNGDVSALSGVPFEYCADFPLYDDTGAETPEFATLVDREEAYREENGEKVTREEAAARVRNTPVTLHAKFNKARGPLKPITRFCKALSAEAREQGLVLATDKRDRDRADKGSSFNEALDTLLKGMRDICKEDSGLAFNRETDVKLAKLAALIEAYGPDVDA
jgi:hypothetical protein